MSAATMRLLPLDPITGGAVFGEYVSELRARGATHRVLASGSMKEHALESLAAFLAEHRFVLRDAATCPTDREHGYQETWYSASEDAVFFLQQAMADHVYLSFVALSKPLATAFRELARSTIDPEREVTERRRGLQVIVAGTEGLRLHGLEMPDAPLVRTNYSETVLGGFDVVAEELCASSPSARLVILAGPPGTGKTHFVRGLAHALQGRANFIVVSAELFEALDGPSLLALFLEQRRHALGVPTVLILEDADRALLRRGTDNLSTVQRLLNLSDGIIGVGLDIRILATTNGQKIEIDPAIRRPGRLLAEIRLEALSLREANIALSAILHGALDRRRRPAREEWGNDEKSCTLARVYERARQLGWKSPPSIAEDARGRGHGALARVHGSQGTLSDTSALPLSDLTAFATASPSEDAGAQVSNLGEVDATTSAGTIAFLNENPVGSLATYLRHAGGIGPMAGPSSHARKGSDRGRVSPAHRGRR